MRISDWSSDVCSSDLPTPTLTLRWSKALKPATGSLTTAIHGCVRARRCTCLMVAIQHPPRSPAKGLSDGRSQRLRLVYGSPHRHYFVEFCFGIARGDCLPPFVHRTAAGSRFSDNPDHRDTARSQ